MADQTDTETSAPREASIDTARALAILEDALEEIAEWYNPDGMGTANSLAGIAVDALDELAELRKSQPL